MTPIDARGQAMELCPLGEGHDHPAGWCCGAKLRQGDGYDRRRAGWGTDHVGVGACKNHLGATRNHRAAARRRLVERDAAQKLADLEYEPVVDPLGQLADLASQAVAIVEFWAAHVPEIASVRYESEKGIEQLRAEVVLYERAMDRAERFLKDLVQLGFEERRLELAEEDRRYFIDILLAVFDGLFEKLQGRTVTEALARQMRRDELPELVERVIDTTGRST